MPTAAIKTLGCKLNQYESEQIREQLLRLGYTMVDFDSPADLYVINSCTVTHEADRDTRRLARRASRLNPAAFVVVTGCYSEVAAAELQALEVVDLVCGQADKARLAELVPHPAADTTPLDDAAHDHLIHGFAQHTRCLIKVQQGCNAHCAYCIIPEARGPSRSIPIDDVLAQAHQLSLAGHPEIVLIGTHLGQYSDGAVDLAELVVQVCSLPEVKRLRLSSIEPREVTDRLISLLPGGGHALTASSLSDPEQIASAKFCRYLHVPLQSGSDAVLKRMNRPYDSTFYADLIRRLHATQPATGLGADVIVGFPGEMDQEFQQTYDLLESLPLSYLHVFTYSRRRRTPAADMPDQVPHELALQRNHLLRDLSERKRAAFAQAMVGQALETVLQTDEGHGWLRGVTDNYLQLRVQAPPQLLHQLVLCQVEAAEDAVLVGRLITTG